MSTEADIVERLREIGSLMRRGQLTQPRKIGAELMTLAGKLRAERDAAARDMREKWPSREVIAREIRRAMLDNPDDASFNERCRKREAIANDAANVILARFENGPDTASVIATDWTGGAI